MFFFCVSDAFDFAFWLLLYCTLFCLLQRTDSELDFSVFECMLSVFVCVFDNYDSDDDDDDNDENV